MVKQKAKGHQKSMQQLENAMIQLKIQYSAEMLQTFKDYMELVLSWNQKVNLTAITDRDEFIKKHFIDSLICAKEEEVEIAQTVIDVGTGAGFPGLPLAIIYPEKQFLLIDSLNKRVKILEEIYTNLNIKNVTVLHSRAEEAGQQKTYRERFDLCVSRAVANLSTLSEYCLPFIKTNGYFLAYKGPDYESELDVSKGAIAKLGGDVIAVKKAALTNFGLEHNIIYIKKIKKTPSNYPRKAGTPAKEPLK